MKHLSDKYVIHAPGLWEKDMAKIDPMSLFPMLTVQGHGVIIVNISVARLFTQIIKWAEQFFLSISVPSNHKGIVYRMYCKPVLNVRESAELLLSEKILTRAGGKCKFPGRMV